METKWDKGGVTQESGRDLERPKDSVDEACPQDEEKTALGP